MSHSSLEQGVVGHWPFATDGEDHSGSSLPSENHGVEIVASAAPGLIGSAAKFNGRDTYLEVADHPGVRFGAGDFAVAAWLNTDSTETDVVGDIVSKFDATSRKGFQLSVVTNAGMTSTAQSNLRNLQFGIDDGRLEPRFTDCGRPGNATLVAALKVHNGALYAGTLETGADEAGHLWRYEGEGRWADLGNPMGCNVVHSVAEFGGDLYCGLGRYNTHGSLLGEALNTNPGGKIFRVDADGCWEDCGQPGVEGAAPDDAPLEGYHTGRADDAMALTVYCGELYCVSNHRTGVFKYEGGKDWKHVGLDLRIISLTVYQGSLYALINGGPLYRYEGGTEWAYCGNPESSTQTYSAVVHYGRLYVGTWPQADVYRYEGGETWEKIGRVGYEREVMGMAFYNGKVYLGALPMASVWRLEGSGFAFVDVLDESPVPLRRVWAMAVYQGRLFAGTLPSGHVRSIEAGRTVTWDHLLPSGWHHIAGVRQKDRLRLYVDGNLVGSSTSFAASDYDLSQDSPMQIGFGPHTYFDGLMSDLRLYNRGLSATEVRALAESSG